MPTLKIDLIEGDIRHTSENGYEITRYAMVYGLTGTAAIRIINAEGQIGVPAIGDGHPDMLSCKLREITGSIESQDCVKLILRYATSWAIWPADPGYTSPPSDNTIQAGAGVTQVETEKDYGDTPLTVYNSAAATALQYQLRTTTKLVPEPSIVITKTEYANPLNKACTYVGKTNMANWSLRPFDAANTWLCTGITGQSVDDGATYQVTYSFLRKEQGWLTELFWMDTTGNPLYGATEGDGKETYQLYSTINFNGLGL